MNTVLIEKNLLAVLAEIRSQPEVGESFPHEMQSYSEMLEQLREYVEDAGEYSVAYEVIVSTLQRFPFRLSGSACVKLLEVGLLMRFKTDLPEDAKFNNRTDDQPGSVDS